MKHCAKCSKEIPGFMKLCWECAKGTTSQRRTHPLLWWQISPEEMDKQVSNYSTLKVTQSARGVGMLCLVFSSALTVVLILCRIVDPVGFVDVVLMLVLGVLMYRGQRWAMVGAMILWTFEKVVAVCGAAQNNLAAPVVTSLIWWAAFMRPMWVAFKVEGERKRLRLLQPSSEV